jgi:hypothetical protein
MLPSGSYEPEAENEAFPPSETEMSAPALATGGKLPVPPHEVVLAEAALDFVEALRELSTAETVYE